MKTYEELREAAGLRVLRLGADGGMGELWRAGKPWATVIWSFGGGWEHVSICPIKRSHVPTWGGSGTCIKSNIRLVQRVLVRKV